MNGILQFGDGATPITYKYLGTVRPNKKRSFAINAVKGSNRAGEPEIIGFKVVVEAIAKDLESTFLDSDQHNFRIIYPDSLEMIELGLRYYVIDYDGLLKRHGIEYHTIRLEFIIPVSQLKTYKNRVPLPASEGGVVLEDSDIYLA